MVNYTQKKGASGSIINNKKIVNKKTKDEIVVKNIFFADNEQIIKRSKQKKLAILFFGISYMEKYNHWDGMTKLVDYKKSVNNYKKYIFHQYKNWNIDVFLSTYDSPKKEQIIKDYHPKQYSFATKMIKNHHISRNKHFETAISLCLNYADKHKITYDNVIII